MHRRTSFSEDVAKAFFTSLAACMFGGFNAGVLALFTDAPGWAVFSVFLLVSNIVYWSGKV